MEAELIRVYQTRPSKNGNMFTRLGFKLDNGSWVKTDVCPDYRNYEEWARLMRFGIGTKIKDFKMRDATTIDADSDFIFIAKL